MIERESGIQPVLPGFEWGETGEMYDHLPYSTLGQWTEEGDIYDKASRNLPLDRLHSIKALSFLSYIGPDPEHTIFMEYPHTRLDHSLTVAIVMEKILQQNGFENTEINIGIIAGLIHDIATPAHGDATKKIDPDALDEEKFWWEAIDRKGQEFTTQKLGIPNAIKVFDDIINNRGLLGQVLDIADRITYTMKDLNAVIHGNGDYNSLTKLSLDPALLPLRYIISHYPRIGNIYKEVGVDRKKQAVFFNNPEHLGVWLLLRAHLYQALYLNPVSLGRDLFVGELMRPLYSRNGNTLLTPEKLRNLTDEELMRIVQKAYYGSTEPIVGFSRIYNDLVNWYPLFKKFGSNKEAEDFAKRLKRRKNIMVIGISECKGFDPATSYRVADQSGNVMPFSEFNPGAAREIEQIAEETKGVFVFFVDLAKDKRSNPLFQNLPPNKK